MSQGLARAIARSWSGAPGSVPWTWAFAPLSLLYLAGSAVARARASRSRRAMPGLRVIAIGGLTAGGSGKSSVADWLAAELLARGAAPAILLRGHGATRPSEGPFVVPDYPRYPRDEATARGGDEAAAHRRALPRAIAVASGRDRHDSAKRVRDGYGAGLAILDDGWEQSTLRWDDLWIVLDPDRPLGNGLPIPAGPLRRPASTLGEGTVIAVIEERGAATPDLEWIRRHAPSAPVLRFQRALAGISPPGAGSGERGAPADLDRAVRTLPPAGLVSGIGAPERLERFARGSGIEIVTHAAFPDHAAWTAGEVERAVEEAARRGANVILTTEKDEARWPATLRSALPVLVLRTRLVPRDPVDDVLARARGSVASRAAIG